MNILSIIYSIPTVPYSSSSMFSALSQPSPTSPTSSASPSSESSPQIPQGLSVLADLTTSGYVANEGPDHDRDFDSTDALNSVMFSPDDANSSGGSVSGLPYRSHHPYATPYPSEANLHHARGQPLLSRRPRASNLPPLQPPPTNSLPPAPIARGEIDLTSQQKCLDVITRQPGDSGHITTNSGLGALTEEYDDVHLDLQQGAGETSGVESYGEETTHYVLETPRNPKRDSHPLPPLPLSSVSPALQPPRSPPRAVAARTRGSSMVADYTAQGTLSQRRKISVPPTPRPSSPADSTISAGSAPKSTASSLPATMPPLPTTRVRSLSQPDRRTPIIGDRTPPLDQPRPPLPVSTTVSVPITRNVPLPSKPNPVPPLSQLVVTDRLVLTNNLPTTPTSPLPPVTPDDPLLKPYHLMNLLRNTMTSPTGGYITRRLHVPHEVWSQGGAKLSNVLDKVRVVAILCNALEDLQVSSADYFGAGNVCSGLASGIGSIGRKEVDAWSAKLEEFSSICDGVVTNFGKKLGVGEGFVLKKSSWGDKLVRGFDKFTNGKK